MFYLAILEFNAIIARMIKRKLCKQIRLYLADFPAVVLLGPRQVGKTTLALALAKEVPSIYLDLESPNDLSKLSDPAAYLNRHENKLVVLDEVQQLPGLFKTLRGLIDQGRRKGLTSARFLLLGSASIELIKQTGESLAGRVAYLELSGLSIDEIDAKKADELWLRGGFPTSFTATNDDKSLVWRENFIRTYLERDIPLLGPRIPAETLRRFWTMLSHNQGQPHNAAPLARGLGVDGKTVARYLDLLVDLLLVRRLQPWFSNIGKRLIKSPKVFVRDSGILHALLGISDFEHLLGHPIVGMSWEGFVMENILSALSSNVSTYFYRSAAGAEVDLLLALPSNQLWAVEIKRSSAPKIEKGFHIACKDLKPSKQFVIYAGDEHYPLSEQIEAISLGDFLLMASQEGLTNSSK